MKRHISHTQDFGLYPIGREEYDQIRFQGHLSWQQYGGEARVGEMTKA